MDNRDPRTGQNRTRTSTRYGAARLSRSRTALFLDFDGTLTEIVDDPGAVRWASGDTARLNQLAEHLSGAIAVVSGRGLDDLGGHLSGFSGILCGGHGSEMAGNGIGFERVSSDPAELVAEAKSFAARHDGVWVEEKSAGFTMHYRQNPEAGDRVRDFGRVLTAEEADFDMHPAKMAWEIRSAHHSKAGAIEALMKTEPFLGRRPVFAGDDTTDFDAFPLVKQLGGLTIALSAPEEEADLHFGTPGSFRHFLFEDDGTWDD